jgi:phosphoglycerate dehydrogenase-like enzyme
VTSFRERLAVGILDDYPGVALKFADWSGLSDRVSIRVFNDHLADADAVVARLLPFDIICVMRERTPLTRAILERLPRLKLIASTGLGNTSIDRSAAAERGVSIMNTGYNSRPTIEMTWALILASARHITAENASIRAGGWQTSVGDDMAGKTLGVIGLGDIGSQVAKVGLAFGMEVVAWSQNLTAMAAAAVGVRLVSKEDLLRQADVISIHMVLSRRTIGLIGAREFALMKPSARLINTSRGPIVVEADLLHALSTHQIAGAALDVFDAEPLPLDHPYRRAENLLATPHIGYGSTNLYSRFYQDTVDNIRTWLTDYEIGGKSA